LHSRYGAWEIGQFLLFSCQVLIDLTKLLHQFSTTPLQTVNAPTISEREDVRSSVLLSRSTILLSRFSLF
jgi:hypothetical protein